MILLSISYSSNGAPSEQWNLTFGEKANDFGHDVQQTSDGGYIFAGRTSLWVHTRNDGPVDVPASDYNAMIIKIDAYGNTEWMKIFGGTGDDWANAVQQTSDGSYIFVGSTGSFTDTTGSYSDLDSNVDAWLVKIDANGNQQWIRTFGGKKYDKANVIQQTLDGGYIFAGAYGSGTGNSDGWLVKTDANGYKQWNSQFGDVEEIRYVEQTSDEGFILTGFSLQYTETRDEKNAFLIKTDAKGILLWRKNFNGDKDDSLNSVNQTSDNGFILAGETSSSGNGFADAWLIKTDINGSADAWLIKVSDDSPDFKSDAFSNTPALTAITTPAIAITIMPDAKEAESTPSFTSSGVNKDKSSFPGFEAGSAIFAILIYLFRWNK